MPLVLCSSIYVSVRTHYAIQVSSLRFRYSICTSDGDICPIISARNGHREYLHVRAYVGSRLVFTDYEDNGCVTSHSMMVIGQR
jgi:hypothetical protein